MHRPQLFIDLENGTYRTVRMDCVLHEFMRSVAEHDAVLPPNEEAERNGDGHHIDNSNESHSSSGVSIGSRGNSRSGHGDHGGEMLPPLRPRITRWSRDGDEVQQLLRPRIGSMIAVIGVDAPATVRFDVSIARLSLDDALSNAYKYV